MRKLILSFLCLIQIAAFADDIWKSRPEGDFAKPEQVALTSLEVSLTPSVEVEEPKVGLPQGFRIVLLILGSSAVGFTFYTAWYTRRQLAQ